VLVFIDDSGDPGFKLEKGSSQFFVIALLIFEDVLEAEKMAIAIKELRRSLKFPDSQEFKYAKSSDRVRLAFLKAITGFSFKVSALVVDKNLIYSRELQNKKETFYAYFIKTAIKNSRSVILDARVRIDGSGDRAFKKQFMTYLRKELTSNDVKIMKHCRLVDSRSDVLIQAVDMIAGAIRRKHELEEVEPYALISKHIDDEWNFQ
jgi:Protein of unknown function (DUF3800)